MDPLLDPDDQLLESELLKAGRQVALSPAARDKTLLALGLGAATATGAGAAKAGLLSSLSTKTGLVVSAGLALVGVAGTAVVLSASPNPGAATTPRAAITSQAGTTQASQAAPRSAPPEVDSVANEHGAVEEPSAANEHNANEHTADLEAAADAPLDEALNERPPNPSPRTPGQPSQEATGAKSPSALSQELAQIGRVETALRGGDAARALSLLTEYRRTFPAPQLGLEAEVLTIQALSQQGQSTEAQRRASQFLQRHPKSPLGARVKRYLPNPTP